MNNVAILFFGTVPMTETGALSFHDPLEGTETRHIAGSMLYYNGKSRMTSTNCYGGVAPMPHDQQAERKAAPIKTILVVEDDTGIAEFLSLAIAQETPYYSLVVADGFEAL